MRLETLAVPLLILFIAKFSLLAHVPRGEGGQGGFGGRLVRISSHPASRFALNQVPKSHRLLQPKYRTKQKIGGGSEYRLRPKFKGGLGDFNCVTMASDGRYHKNSSIISLKRGVLWRS